MSNWRCIIFTPLISRCTRCCSLQCLCQRACLPSWKSPSGDLICECGSCVKSPRGIHASRVMSQPSGWKCCRLSSHSRVSSFGCRASVASLGLSGSMVNSDRYVTMSSTKCRKGVCHQILVQPSSLQLDNSHISTSLKFLKLENPVLL